MAADDKSNGGHGVVAFPLTVGELFLALASRDLHPSMPVYAGDDFAEGACFGIETHGPDGGVKILADILILDPPEPVPAPPEPINFAQAVETIRERIATYRRENARNPDSYNPLGVEKLLQSILIDLINAEDGIPF